MNEVSTSHFTVLFGGYFQWLKVKISWLVSGTKNACRDLLTRYFQMWDKPFKKCFGKLTVNKRYSVPHTTLDMPQSTENRKEINFTDVKQENKNINSFCHPAHCRMLICSDLSPHCFANVPVCVSVVHDQHRPHLQPLEKLGDSLLCERSAGLLWRHGLACQHQWCKGVVRRMVAFCCRIYYFF